jgi:septal ring factor EnvC (AmiA/AmiB activator)
MDNSFDKYYDEFIKSVSVSASSAYTASFNEERQYWTSQLDEQWRESQKELRRKENEIRILTEENVDLRASLKSKEYKNAALRRRIKNIYNSERSRSVDSQVK